MSDTPMSLQNCSLQFICNNLSALCTERPNSSVVPKQNEMVFKDPEACIHNLSDKLLSMLSDKGTLDDNALTLFNPKVTRLQHVSINNASVTCQGLRILKGHKVSKLEVTGLKEVTVNDIIRCLSEWTLSNLRVLNVSGNTFLNNANLFVVAPLSQLKNLHALNVSWTEFNQHGLDIIAEDLPCLEVLDFSCTTVKDISPLRKCMNRLRSLKMYNLQFDRNSDPIGVVSQLTQLVHLDVSNNATRNFVNTEGTTEPFNVPEYLAHPKFNPNLISLDVSGSADVAPAVIEEFLENHSEMSFLGLALTSISDHAMFQTKSSWYKSREGFKVSGEANEEQIMESLQRYLPRSHYVQTALYELFDLFQGITVAREDLIKLILPAMKSHPQIPYLQLVAIACLRTLTRRELGLKMHPTLLAKCVDVALTAMESFPHKPQLQLNAIVMLDSSPILYDVKFDKFKCVRLVMECMSQFNNARMIRKSVAICSILMPKISTEQMALLSAEPRYMKRLVQILKARLMSGSLDYNLIFTLCAIGSLTDEAPSMCKLFLDEGGLELLIQLLRTMECQQFEYKVRIETKIFGLLSKFVQIKALRAQLMRGDLISLIKQRLHWDHIHVTYLAAYVLAHWCRDGDEGWLAIYGVESYDILDGLVTVAKFEATGNTEVTVNDTIRHLLCSRLRNLQVLNVSHTEFRPSMLDIIADELPCLEVLDISCTEVNDISGLRWCKSQLRSLKMYNLQFKRGSDPIGVVRRLTQLVRLDVSNNATRDPQNTEGTTEPFNVQEYLSDPKFNPNLISLDISGSDDVTPAAIKEFLENHPQMTFLGLALTSISEYEIFQTNSEWYQSHEGLKVSGEANEEQIMESLQRYLPRSHYVQTALYKLFDLSQGITVAREDLIKLVLPVMQSHPHIPSIQLAATACLYYLTRGEIGLNIQPWLLAECTDLTLTLMENFPDDQQLQKNALIMLLNDRILYDLNFDHFRCVLLVMECMCQFNDGRMNQMSVDLFSILAHKLSTDQMALLSAQPRYMKKLLQILKATMMSGTLNRDLRFTLCAMWSLTDEAPSVCKLFLEEGGLELVMKLLLVTEGEQSDQQVNIEIRIFGLLSNLSAVKTLRGQLMREDLIRLIRHRLHGKYSDVTYLAAAILAHLCSDGDAAWLCVAGLKRSNILDDLQSVVSQWEQPKTMMIKYRSFRTLFPLLQTSDTPIQLWAVWAILFICLSDGQTYLPLLESEGGPEHIRKLMQQCDPQVEEICRGIISKLEELKGKPPCLNETAVEY